MEHSDPWQLHSSAAEMYERYTVPAVHAHWAMHLVELAALQPGERVLDVGCGTGVVARVAAQHVGATGQVIGLDLNGEMLAVARALPPVPGASITWQDGSVAAMPFADMAFDVVFCQQGLQFFPEPLTALREMHRVLVPGGRVALNVFRTIEHSPGHVALTAALERHVSSQAAASRRVPFALGEAEALRALLTKAGFHDVVIHPEVKMARFPSAEEFVRQIILASAAYAETIAFSDMARRAALLSDIRAALRSYMDAEGLALPMGAHLALAHT